MKKSIQLILILGILFSYKNSYSQDFEYYNIDSLTAIWEDTRQHDTVRLNALVNVILNKISENNLDTTKLYLEKLNKMEAGRTLKKYQCLNEILLVKILEKSDPQQAEIHLAKGIEFGKAAGFNDGLSELYNVRALFYFKKGQIDKAKEDILMAFELAEKASNKWYQSNIAGNISRVYMATNEKEKAIIWAKKSIALSKVIGYKWQTYYQLVALGHLHLDSNTLLALDYFKKVEKENVEYNAVLTQLYRGLERAYRKLEDWQNAKIYSLKIIAILKKVGMTRVIAMDYISTGNIFVDLGQFENALIYVDSARVNALDDELGTIVNVMCQQLEARVFQKKNNNQKAIDTYQKVMQQCLKNKGKKVFGTRDNYTDIYNQSQLGLGKIYLEKKNYTKALDACKKSYEYFEQKSFAKIGHTRQACDCVYQSYKAKSQGNKAVVFLEKLIAIDQKSAPVESAKKMQALEFSRIQMADSLSQVEKDLRTEMTFQAELQQKNQSRNIALGIGGMIFLLAGGLWNRLNYTRKANVEIEKQKDRAEKSEKFKEQFLANMSHEIRTPMHAISGMTKILKRNNHTSDQDIYLNAIDQSSNNLLVILNDILDLSKIEAGKIRVESIPMSPTNVIENVLDILKFKAEDKGLYLTSKIANDIPPNALGDPHRLNQILINLAGNAIKFTEKGMVKIKLDKVVRHGKALLEFEIEDTGVGIPSDQLERIFESFEQGDKTLGKKFGGTGLGLHISKELIELQDGKIWVESEVGQGSHFFFTLPLIIGEGLLKNKITFSDAKLKTMGEEMSGLKILLAEDNDFNALVANDDLTYYIPDLIIDRVENGLDALVFFQKEKYDLVLMDVQMPEMDGYEASERIRVLEKDLNSKTPIIAMTASLLKTEIQQCYDAGMDNYIPKPYQAEELIGRIYEEVKK